MEQVIGNLEKFDVILSTPPVILMPNYRKFVIRPTT